MNMDDGQGPEAGGMPSPGEATTGTRPEGELGNSADKRKAAQNASRVQMARMLIALESASLWMEVLPTYAAHQKRVGNRWALAAGMTAAFTGLAVWPLIGDQLPDQLFGLPGTTAAAIAVSFVAFFSAICALVPRILRHTEMAERAQEITQLYASVFGLLIDLTVEGREDFDREQARRALELFEEAKMRKGKLDRLPPRAELNPKRKVATQSYDERMEMAMHLVEAARQRQAELSVASDSGHRDQPSAADLDVEELDERLERTMRFVEAAREREVALRIVAADHTAEAEHRARHSR